jgi:hypothetical protein
VWITSDFNRLDHVADFRGDLCGKKGTTVENIPYAYYFDPVGVPDIVMCVASCPAVDVFYNFKNLFKRDKKFVFMMLMESL